MQRECRGSIARNAHARRSHQPRTTRRIGVLVLTAEERSLARSLLSKAPRPSYAEVARTIGVHWQVIQRLHRKIEAEKALKDAGSGATESENGGFHHRIDAEGKKLAKYKRLLERELPIEERVKIITDLARSKNPYAQAKAIEQIHEIEGVTAATKRRAAEQAAIPVPGPMFILPAGDFPAIDAPKPSRDMDRFAVTQTNADVLLKADQQDESNENDSESPADSEKPNPGGVG